MITSDIGGQLGTTRGVANYPGFEMITGPDLVARFEMQAEPYGIDKLASERVVGVREAGGCKVVLAASGRELSGQTLILATGAQKRTLRIPGEKALAGRGVVYCSTCDGPLFRDNDIAIVGGGNSGLEAALEMAGVASRVYRVSVDEFSGDEILLLGANERGEIESDARGNTVAGGVFAAGDVRQPVEANRHRRARGVRVSCQPGLIGRGGGVISPPSPFSGK